VERLMDEGLIKGIADFYDLKRDDLLALEGVKDKSADNMLAAIEASRHRPLWRLLIGLNIRYMGEKTAQIIARTFSSMDKLMQASEAEIVGIPGIGPKIGHSVY